MKFWTALYQYFTPRTGIPKEWGEGLLVWDTVAIPQGYLTKDPHVEGPGNS
jgi:hypothetical protein